MSPLANAVMSLPFVPAGKRELFHVPEAWAVRTQRIARAADEEGWPFSGGEGTLACMWSAGQKHCRAAEEGLHLRPIGPAGTANTREAAPAAAKTRI